MHSQLIVSKFGGTSMGSATTMLKAAEILRKNSNNRLVVVSATSGTTNSLLELFQSIISGRSDRSQILDKIESRHREISESLKPDSLTQQALFELFSELRLTIKKLECTQKAPESESLDHFLSFGERLSSVLFRQAVITLGASAHVFDVRTVLRTDSFFGRAEPQPSEIGPLCSEKLTPVLREFDIIVTQGFIGSDAEGRTTTLGRGGSDFSASLLGEGLDALEVHIWTDVNGIYTVDPKLVPHSHRIEHISFAEAAELANFGAKVLHPATLWPAIRKKIRVFVGSTFEPEGGGTWIHPDLEARPLVQALAVRKDQTLITVNSLRMLNAYGFLAKVFSILADHQINIDLVTTSEVSIALTVDGTSLGSSGKKITENRDLVEQLRKVADIQIEEDLCLVAVIGNRLTSTAGFSAKAFGTLREFDIRLICYGASEHNLCFLTKKDEATQIIQRLHHVFIEPVLSITN